MLIFSNKAQVVRRVLAMVAVLAIIATACSSSADVASETVDDADVPEDASPDSSDVEAPEPDVEEPEPDLEAEADESEDETDEEPTEDAGSDTDVVIEGSVEADPLSFEGQWTTIQGADLLGCEGGSVNERRVDPSSTAMTLRCEQGGSGSLVGSYEPFAGSAEWILAVTEGDFVDLSGGGQWTGAANQDFPGGEFRLELDLEVGQVAVPLAAHDRIVQFPQSECLEGFLTSDGLAEYGNAGDALERLDLVSGELTAHGAPPSECAWWLGDIDLGRRVALSTDNGPSTIWFGPFDGDFEIERTFIEPVSLLNRSLRGNRLVLRQFNSGSVILVDATTGEDVGDEFPGSFLDGRDSTGAVISADGELIAFGGADVVSQAGVMLLVTAETGEEFAQVELPIPPVAAAFDPSGEALIAALADGSIVTVDLTSFEITSTIATDSTERLVALGVRSDGLIVAATESGAFLADRVEGPTGDEIAIKLVGTARIRPDGGISTLVPTQVFEHYEIDG